MLRILWLWLAVLLVSVSLAPPIAAQTGTSASGSCGVSQHFGKWTRTDRQPGIYALDVSLPNCDPPYRVIVTLLRDDGTLYKRDPVAGQVSGPVMTAKVFTGGYQDIMRMQVRDISGRRRLVVDILHDSLDSKPDGRSQIVFDKGWFAPPPKPPPVTRSLGKRRAPPGTPLTGTRYMGSGDWDGDGFADIIYVERATGRLRLYPGDGTRGYANVTLTDIGSGWGNDAAAGMIDWDGDGHRDLLAYDDDGDLWLYPGQSRRTPSAEPRVKIGNGWAGSTIAGVGDWDRDGMADIVVRRNAPVTELMLYPGQNVRGYSQVQPVSMGITLGVVVPHGLVDWDGDGRLDIIGMQGLNGDLLLWPGNGDRRPITAPPVRLGTGWKGYAPFGLIDWDKDGFPDVIVKEVRSGDVWMYPGNGRRGPLDAPRVRIGNGF